MTTREDIVAAARTWIGVPWRHQGRSRRGVDCAGVVARVGRDLGLIDYDYTAYRRRPRHDEFVSYFVMAGGIRRPIQDAQPGDVLVLAETVYPCHCAILTPDQCMIHAHLTRRKVVCERLDAYWLDRRAAAFSYPGLD